MKHNQCRTKIIRAVTVSMSVGFYEPLIPELQSQGYDVVSVSSPGPELDRLRAKGVKAIEVSMERRMAPFKDLKSLFKLIKVFNKEKPYIVHSMTPKAGMLCMLAAWLTRVPRRVHTFTGLVWPTASGLSRRVLMFTDWLTCACATHVIPEGQGVLNDLQMHITHKPMKVLGYGNVKGVDMVQCSRRREVMQIAERLKCIGVFTFLFVGRLVGDKGINELVQAFNRLHSEFTNIRLILVGERESHLDPLLSDMDRLIQEDSSIVETGVMMGDELMAWYAASDALVFPSYREGFPNVVLEAGAMGLPCIVTDINGSREIIEEGKNGIVIPSKNTDALYSAMKWMLQHPEKTAELAENARPMIASRFERHFVQQCLYDFYREL